MTLLENFPDDRKFSGIFCDDDCPYLKVSDVGLADCAVVDEILSFHYDEPVGYFSLCF